MGKATMCSRCGVIIYGQDSHWFIDKTSGAEKRYYDFCNRCYDDFLNNWVNCCHGWEE